MQAAVQFDVRHTLLGVHAWSPGITAETARFSRQPWVYGTLRSTLPCRERRTLHDAGPPRYPDSNPRSRAGSDMRWSPPTTATTYFNPRSRAGSDHSQRVWRDRACNFNPRSRAGSDLDTFEVERGMMIFQSTLPCGERLRRAVPLHHRRGFQSTLPCGERLHPAGTVTRRDRNFNPRSRAGSDSARSYGLRYAFCISIHAPVRGATGDEGRLVLVECISIHAPVRGATW